jgi:hypothetical protein
MTARWPTVLGSPSTSRDTAKLNLVLWLKLRGTNANTWEFARAQLQQKEKELRRALRCRRSSSGSADFDRKSLRVDGVCLNI